MMLLLVAVVVAQSAMADEAGLGYSVQLWQSTTTHNNTKEAKGFPRKLRSG